MNCQMIRVISSPSSSTTGFFTLIFAILRSHFLRAGIGNGRRTGGKFGARSFKAPLPQPRLARGLKPHLCSVVWVRQRTPSCRSPQRSETGWMALGGCGPKPDLCAAASSPLFDHLVGAAEERERHCKTERRGGLEV